MSMCPVSREAVLEQEEYGEVGCPLCGRPAREHPPEPQSQDEGMAMNEEDESC